MTAVAAESALLAARNRNKSDNPRPPANSEPALMKARRDETERFGKLVGIFLV